MRQIFALIALLALLGSSLSGQAASAPGSPSRLRAANRGSDILLSWEAASDPAGGWVVYRSNVAVNEQSLTTAVQMAIAAPSDRSYVAVPPDNSPYFFAVLALDAEKKPLRYFASGKSVTAAAIAAEAIKAKPANAAAATASAAALAVNQTGPAISGLQVTAAADSVKLAFTIAKGTGNVLVYRGLAPFVDASKLLDAILISTIGESLQTFIDFPVPGLAYYYALLPESALKAGKIAFQAGMNASKEAATIQTSGLYGVLPEIGDLSRITPLPSFVFGNPAGRDPRRNSAKLPAEVEKAIGSILAPYPLLPPSAPVIGVLSEDRGQAKGGEDYSLSLIIQGPLKQGSYAEAVSQLQRYLSLNRSKAVASRAHFYLGQAFAKTGAYRDAFFEFLQARDLHAVQAKPWILYLVAVLRG